MYINIYVSGGFVRKIEVTKRVFKFEDEIEAIIETSNQIWDRCKTRLPKRIPRQTRIHPHIQRLTTYVPKP